jgi:hypothetical protein
LEVAQNEEPCLLGAGRVLENRGSVLDRENYLPASLVVSFAKCDCPQGDKMLRTSIPARRDQGVSSVCLFMVRYEFIEVEGEATLSLRRMTVNVYLNYFTWIVGNDEYLILT